jgi:two-component system sensor histidine kinase TctE
MANEGVLLRRQLLKWLSIALALLFTVDTFASYWMARTLAGRAYDRALVEMARDLSLHVHTVDDNGRIQLDLPPAALALLFNNPDDRFFHEVTTPGDERVAGQALPRPAMAAASEAELLYDGRVEEQPVRVVQLTVGAERETGRPAAVVRVAQTLGQRTALGREMLLGMILPQLLLIALATTVVWIGGVLGLRPLEAVRDSVLSRSPQDLGLMPVEGVPGEVRPLLHAINGLLQRLDVLLAMQRRFIADAAHQLKTPVAALLAQIEVAMREQDPGRRQEQLQALNAGLSRLGRLMSQLLSLARNDPEDATAARLVPMDLSALALEAASAWVPEAMRRGIDLGFEGGDDAITVQGDAIRLRELLDNLLDNAIRYTNEGGRVTVRMEGGPRPTVRIADDGPTIPAADRERVFERFHRILGSPGDGSGLGLAIAREIAQMHDARIGLEPDSDGIGNVFSIVFPGHNGL